MARAWFLAIPPALFAFVLVNFDLEMALVVGLVSFVSATFAYLVMTRLAWRGANFAALALALAGPILFGLAEDRVSSSSRSPSPAAGMECPPEGCRMIGYPSEPGAAR